jgi:hypothetical protein
LICSVCATQEFSNWLQQPQAIMLLLQQHLGAKHLSQSAHSARLAAADSLPTRQIRCTLLSRVARLVKGMLAHIADNAADRSIRSQQTPPWSHGCTDALMLLISCRKMRCRATMRDTHSST